MKDDAVIADERMAAAGEIGRQRRLSLPGQTDEQQPARVARGAARMQDKPPLHADHQRAHLVPEKVVERLPVDEIDDLYDARIALANISEEMGDIEEAIRSYELILREEPDSKVALARVPHLYMEVDRVKDAVRALRAQLRVTSAPEARAEVLYHLGETYRILGDDPELTIDSYFKAIDLDPTHVGTLRQLLRYFCEVGDWESATEMASDLAAQGELLQTATGLPLLHRAAIAAALCDNAPLTKTLGSSLGLGSLSEIARALRDIYRGIGQPEADDLARAANAVCQATGDDFTAMIDVLEKTGAGQVNPLVDELRKLDE